MRAVAALLHQRHQGHNHRPYVPALLPAGSRPRLSLFLDRRRPRRPTAPSRARYSPLEVRTPSTFPRFRQNRLHRLPHPARRFPAQIRPTHPQYRPPCRKREIPAGRVLFSAESPGFSKKRMVSSGGKADKAPYKKTSRPGGAGNHFLYGTVVGDVAPSLSGNAQFPAQFLILLEHSGPSAAFGAYACRHQAGSPALPQ